MPLSVSSQESFTSTILSSVNFAMDTATLCTEKKIHIKVEIVKAYLLENKKDPVFQTIFWLRGYLIPLFLLVLILKGYILLAHLIKVLEIRNSWELITGVHWIENNLSSQFLNTFSKHLRFQERCLYSLVLLALFEHEAGRKVLGCIFRSRLFYSSKPEHIL